MTIEGATIRLDVEIPERFDNRDTWIREATSACGPAEIAGRRPRGPRFFAVTGAPTRPKLAT